MFIGARKLEEIVVGIPQYWIVCVHSGHPILEFLLTKGFTLLRYSSDHIVKTNIFWFLVRLENIYGDFPNYIYDSVNLNIAVKYILKNWNGQYVSFAPGRYLIFGKLMLL